VSSVASAVHERGNAMSRTLGILADRLVGAIVPKTNAGACVCNDCYYTPCSAGGGNGCKRCCTNCNCTSTSCGACAYPSWYC
jgi:hypothetical protein